MRVRSFLNRSLRAAVFSLVLCSGCALPRGEGAAAKVLPKSERAALNYYREGLFYYEQNRFDDAEARFLKAAKLFPSSVNIQLSLALTVGRAGDVDSALDQIAALELSDSLTRIEVYAARGLLQVSDGNFEGAINSYRAAYQLALTQNVPVAQSTRYAGSLASLSLLLGKEDEGWCWQHEVEQLGAPTAVPAVLNTVRAQLATGHYQVAYKKLTTFAEAFPAIQTVDTVRVTSLAAAGIGDTSEALRLTRSLALLPGGRGGADNLVADAYLLYLIEASAEGYQLESVVPVTEETGIEQVDKLRESLAEESAEALFSAPEAITWPASFVAYLLRLYPDYLTADGE